MAAARHEPCCRSHLPSAAGEPGSQHDDALCRFWHKLPLPERRRLMRIDRRILFEAIRTRYCSRCYGLFALRYEELRCNGSGQDGGGCSACQACPACQDFFLGLAADPKAVRLEDRLLEEGPFAMFAQSRVRERERDLQFMTAGDVCGSGFSTRRSGKVCALHSSRVSPETLLAYWQQLPPEHRTALFSLPRHDFEAELDSCCSLQLRICKDCRYNVFAQYKAALAAGRRACGHGRAPLDDAGRETSLALSAPLPLVPVCEGFSLSVTDAEVQLVGSDAAALLEEAEEIEDLKGPDGRDGDGGAVRHAETPELAQEVLLDAVLLIFKAQVEVAFREQTAGHNALLLLVALSHELLEARLRNAFLDVDARAAEVELLELVAEDEKKKLAGRSCRRGKRSKGTRAKGKKAALQLVSVSSDSDVPAPATPQQQRKEQTAVLETAAAESSDSAALRDRPPSPDRHSSDVSSHFLTPSSSGGSSGADSSAAKQPLGSHHEDAADASLVPLSAVDGHAMLWGADAVSGLAAEAGKWEVQQRSRRSASRRLSPLPDALGAAETPVPNGPLDAQADSASVAAPAWRQQGLALPQASTGNESPWVQAVAAGGRGPSRPLPSAAAVAIPQPGQRQQQQQQPSPVQRPVWPTQAVQPHPKSQAAGISRRSSMEYSLWGEDGTSSMPLHVSESRESLVTASSVGSPPVGSQPQLGAAFLPLQTVAESAAAALASQHPQAAPAGNGAGFSLFCNFTPPASGGGGGTGAWCSGSLSGAVLFGGGGLGGGISALSF